MTSIKYLGKYFLWHIKTDPKSFICLYKDIGVREKLRDGAVMGWTQTAARILGAGAAKYFLLL